MTDKEHIHNEMNAILDESIEQPTGLIDLLGDTLQSSQNAFSSFYPILERILQQQQQNQQMAQSINPVLQQLIMNKVRIDTHFHTSQDSPLLTITIHNGTPCTIQISTGRLMLTPRVNFTCLNDQRSSEYENGVQKGTTLDLISSCQHTTSVNGQLSSQPEESLFLPDLTTTTTATPILLPPNADHQEVICIQTASPIQYDGLVDIHIPIPGHEVKAMDDQHSIHPLHLTHSFGIYIIDQIKKVVVNKEENGPDLIDEQNAIERNYRGDFIRDTLAIHPVLGLEKGMLICLEMATVSKHSDAL
ncbi:hypothetical protein BC941DRAFT_429060 [Chlamydoabsidia padenii]|nr:hypothetical protein BC941DRAFT_429060 [Chlamydoabsidia padenii]